MEEQEREQCLVLKEQVRKLKERHPCVSVTTISEPCQDKVVLIVAELSLPSITVILLPVPCGAQASKCKAYVTVDPIVPFIFYLIQQFSIICDRSSVLFS